MDKQMALGKKEIMTFEDLAKRKDWEEAVLVITQSSFEHEYTEEERSYVVNSSSEWFYDESQYELYGDCLKSVKNGSTEDTNVLISYYLSRETNPWKIEYCYILS